MEAHIKGVPEALKNLTDAGAIDPVVKATVVLSESGFASIPEAVAYGEIKDDSIAGKLKGFFGAGSSSSPSDSETETEHETAARSEAPEESETAAAGNSSKEEKKKSKVEDTIVLEVETKLASIPPMSVAEKRTARDRYVDIMSWWMLDSWGSEGCVLLIRPSWPSVSERRLGILLKAISTAFATSSRTKEKRPSGSALKRRSEPLWAKSSRRHSLGFTTTVMMLQLTNTLSNVPRLSKFSSTDYEAYSDVASW